MINQQLIDFIKQQTQQGITPENIKTALRSNGWVDADIDQAFINLTTPTPIPTAFSSAPSAPLNQVVVPSPKGVTVIAILYFLGSLLALLFGALALFGADKFTQLLGNGFIGQFFAIGGVIFIAIGILGIAVGIGLLKYKNWARFIAIFFAVVGIALAILAMVKGSVSGNIFNLVVNGLMGGYLFFSPRVRYAFEPQKGFVPLDKKSFWISLVALLLICGAAGAYGSTITPAPTTDTSSTTTDNTVVTPTTITDSQIADIKNLYMQERVEMDAVKTMTDLEAVVSKYGSAAQVAKLTGANLAKVDALPQVFKDQMVTLAKNPPSNQITITGVTVIGTTATLNAQSTKAGFTTGIVTYLLEYGQWKSDLESWSGQQAQATQPTTPTQPAPPANTITSCGSIKFAAITYAPDRTASETSALNCMVQALPTCGSKALMVLRHQTTTYKVESKETQYCNISRDDGSKTVCRIPLAFIAKERKQFNNSDGVFLQDIINAIDYGGKIVDGFTNKETTEFVCQ